MNGAILFEGLSRIDKRPIVAIATGLKTTSANAKTGNMVQTWILCADVDPITALRTGRDVSICGACVHRPKDISDPKKYRGRSCYVNPLGPQSIYRAYKRGAYRSGLDVGAMVSGRMVRLGSYGDPAAVPLDVWDRLLASAKGHTGYTHQWRADRLSDALKYCQVSADSPADTLIAKGLGVGSFRVLASGEKPLPFETICPASEEAGRKATCETCQLCTGSGGGFIAIQAHGIGKTSYKRGAK